MIPVSQESGYNLKTVPIGKSSSSTLMIMYLHPIRYHKQFYHGISSVSGKEFVQPVETRWVDQDLVEGLCHQCHTWVAVSNVKRKNSVLWYRHAHKVKPKRKYACVYHTHLFE